jgi:hypothetical protein
VARAAGSPRAARPGAIRPATDNAYGISVATLRAYAKKIGTNHELAMQLWRSGSLDARILASFVADPKQLTLARCTRGAATSTTGERPTPPASRCSIAHHWRGNGGAVDSQKGEFQKRAGFVMMACLAAHDQAATDAAS